MSTRLSRAVHAPGVMSEAGAAAASREPISALADTPPILGPMAPITWMVMSRDVSHAVRVADQPVVVAALILDVDTGLIRGLSVAEDVRDALAQAVERALSKPAGSLPPGRPHRILAAVGLGYLVGAEFGRRSGLNLIPPIDEIVPGAEAEDIFDSFVGSMAGRRPASDPPSPDDWKVLFDRVQTYAEAAPWDRWADEIDFVVDASVDGERRHVKAVVMGNAGIQPGLALFPGKVIEADLEHRDSTAPWPFEPQTLACTLDNPAGVPVEITAVRFATAGPKPLTWFRASSVWMRKAAVNSRRPMRAFLQSSPRPCSPTTAVTGVHWPNRDCPLKAIWLFQTPVWHAMRFSTRSDPINHHSKNGGRPTGRSVAGSSRGSWRPKDNGSNPDDK